MKEDEDMEAEQQELLYKPTTGKLLDKKRGTIIPPQPTGKDKPRVTLDEDGRPDVVSAAIGDYGRWQLLNTFLLSLFSFPCTFHIYLPTFTARATDFWCRQPSNLSTLDVSYWRNYSQPSNFCNVRLLSNEVTAESIMNHTAPLSDVFEKCTQWDYDTGELGTTIISEWDLVCDRAGYTQLVEVVFLIGVGAGGVLGGWVSDKFGRKRILMGMMVAQSALAIMSLLVRSFLQYMLVRLVMGLVSVSVVYAAFVLAVEIVGGKWVTIAGICVFFPLPVSYVLVSLVSMYLPNWRQLQLAISLPGCLLLLLWCVLPESPKWLLNMGKINEAKIILQKAAKFNNRELPPDLDKMLSLYKNDNPVKSAGVLLVFKGPMLKRSICLFVSWFSLTMAYYGLLLNIGNIISGNLHLSSIVLALVEIPAIAISIPILLKAGRRYPIFISMVVCGCACVASQLLGEFYDDDWVIIPCLMVGKFAIGATNMMMPIFTAELYPTLIRNLGVGASQISAGLALMCIPYLWKLTDINKHLPMVTIAILSVIGGAIVLLLPETGEAEREKTKPDSVKRKITSNNTSPYNGTFRINDDRGH